ncbi:MAG: hypothetical protein HY722_15370 [Planctomycetes bacterium]|nr:hypothetical protein [Planctomycetota bacterium]
MRASPVYADPRVYDVAMRLLYGPDLALRYRALSRRIPDGVEVAEHCCGTAELYRRHLRRRHLAWRGYDTNATFLRWARARGLPVSRADVLEDPLPEADWVLIQASLYQFAPRCRDLLVRLAASARVALLVAEPIRNLGTHPSRLVRWLAHRGAALGRGPVGFRFDREMLHGLASSFGGDLLDYREGRREDLFLLRGHRGAVT